MQLDRIEGKPDETVAWGSDVAAQMLRRLGISYVSLNPGASYRGLHDSLVNHLGNERPCRNDYSHCTSLALERRGRLPAPPAYFHSIIV